MLNIGNSKVKQPVVALVKNNKPSQNNQLAQSENIDRVELSSTFKDSAEQMAKLQQERQEKLAQREQQLDMLKDILEETNNDESSEKISELSRCLTISSRIMSGDKVPMKDEKYLREKRPEMYSRAIMLRKQKLEPKKHKSVLPDDYKTQQEKALEKLFFGNTQTPSKETSCDNSSGENQSTTPT